MFEDRFEQFVTLGIPRTDVEAMRDAINDMWSDAPGGWVHEWSRFAKRYADARQPQLRIKHSLMQRVRSTPSASNYATQMLGTATFWNRCGEATTEEG